jgi:hypothetical protein
MPWTGRSTPGEVAKDGGWRLSMATAVIPATQLSTLRAISSSSTSVQRI